MIKFFKLTPTYFLGFFPLGLFFLALQELPYLILPRLGYSISPLMELPSQLPWLDFLEKTFGILTVIALTFIGRDGKNYRLFLRAAVVPLCCYYVGWTLYFLGFQNLLFFLFFLVAMPPLYYFFLGLWRKNNFVVWLSLLFLIIHLVNFSLNFTA
jgi:hypothetical protein